jgi:PKD repeat protein
MKTIFKHLMLTTTMICCSMFFAIAQGNFVIEGNVNLSGGGVKANWPVTIKSLANTPTLNATVYTNANGHYSYVIANGAVIGPNMCWEVSTKDTCTPGTIVIFRDTVCNLQGTVSSAVVDFTIGFQFTLSQNVASFFASSVGTGPFSYLWSFGDGSPTSNDANPVHTYQPGHYRACVRLEDATGCIAYYCDSVHITSTNICIADFTTSTNGLGVNTVAFTDVSTSSSPNTIVSWAWNFGDNSSSNVQNPVHTYSAAGTYNVCLTITTSNGCTNTMCRNVTVGNLCEAHFTSTVSGNTATFNNTSTFSGGSATYYWTFGDNTSSTAQHPTHTYNSAGTYQVCLVVSTPNNCTHTYCQNVVITSSTPPCEAYFTYSINGNVVTFTNASNTLNINATYLWTFGDGSDASTVNATHTYANPGTYQACLYVITPNNCRDTICKSITITNTIPCEANFTYSINGNVVAFTNTSNTLGSVATYHWDFGDNTDASTVNATHTYSQPGTYQVCLILITPNNVCRDTICKTIIIQGTVNRCEAAFTATPVANLRVEFSNTSYSANPNATSYVWSYGDGTTASGFAPDHIYSSAGTYTVCLYMFDQAANCRDTICKSVIVGQNTPVCTAYFNYSLTSIGSPFAVLFTDVSTTSPNDAVVSWTWDFGDGSSSILRHPTHTYTAPGQYVVCLTITTALGCTNTVCKPVILGNNTTCAANFTFTTNGLVATFTNTSTPSGTVAAYRWTFGDNTSSTDQNPVHTYSTPGQYRVCLTITTSNGCVSDICKNVTVGLNSIHCDAAFTAHVVANNRVEFSNNSVSTNPNATSYKWTFGDGTFAYAFAPDHIYQTAGTYTVCLYMYDQAANCRDTICKPVVVGTTVVPPCEASFSYTVIGTRVEFHSTSVPMFNTTSHYWTFGDGTTSALVNPQHIFANAGTYTVCLTIINSINGCTDDVCHTIVIGSSQQQFCLSGRICKGINSNPAFPATVYLIYYDSIQGTLTAVRATSTSQTGEYEFCNVPRGKYLVKAALTPNAPDYHNYMPTYYGNSLFWRYATSIILNQNRQQVDICLIAGNNPGGPGFVGGYVQQGANKTSNAAGDALVGVQVFLLDLNDNPIQFTFSDEDGRFTFDDVAYGTYKVYAEVLDKETFPYLVTIGPEEPDHDNIILLVESTKVISGVEEKANSVIRSLRVYPNPVNDRLNIELNLANRGDVNITVTDVTGRVIVEEILNGVSGNQTIHLNMLHQQSGFYIVNIIQGGVNKTVKLLKL